MKGIKILLVILLVGSIASGVFAKPAEVYLLPSQNGEPSEIVPVGDKPSAFWLIQYDDGEIGNVLSGLLPGDTLGVFFIPPAVCSLIEVHFCRYRLDYEPGPTGYYGIVADVPDGVTLGDFGEYHSAASTPGPSCIGTILAGPAAMDITAFLALEWDTLDVPGDPDVEENAFWAGWTVEDTTHSTAIDAEVAPPYHAIGYKQGGAGPAENGPGWYSSWHLFYVRALVKVYANIGPVIEADELLGTYATGVRRVDIYTEDFGPTDAGIATLTLRYYVEAKAETLDITPIQDSVDTSTPSFEYAWWHAEIPGQAPGSTVNYWLEGVDNEGADGSTGEFSYLVGAGMGDYGLLYMEGDEALGVMGIHNAFEGHPWDLWWEHEGGVADNTVTDFYVTGAGDDAICWLSFSGATFAADDVGWSYSQAFRDFMDNGGCIFLQGQDIPAGGYGLTPDYTDWVAPPSPHPLRDYLMAYEGYDDYIGASPFSVFVDNTQAVTLDMAEELVVDCAAAMQSTWVGIFTLLDDGCVPLFFDGEGNILGYMYESAKGFKVVYLYFPFHAITTTADQDIFIEN
ncbi:hypothetical protein KAX35_00085, partial [candidate division WOR-3 bacterium]|nr:hypothetical protein [candidate division WOR-3 bacterium]